MSLCTHDVSNWLLLCKSEPDYVILYVTSEDTDDETGQVLRGIDSLPPLLRRYVHEDNRWFQQELSEWEQEQFCQTAAPQGESTVSAEPPNTSPDNIQQTPAGPPDEELGQGTDSEPQPAQEEEQDPKPDPREKPEGNQGVESEEGAYNGIFIYVYYVYIYVFMYRHKACSNR